VGWGREGRDEQEEAMRLTKNLPGGLIAIIILAVAALNLIFLVSELTMNVVRVYFG
jgi:hypothetical protein